MRSKIYGVSPQIVLDNGTILLVDRYGTTVSERNSTQSLDALQVGQQIQATYRLSLGHPLAKAITITQAAAPSTAAASPPSKPSRPAADAPKLGVLRSDKSDKKSQPSSSAPQTPSTTPSQLSSR